MRLRQQASVRDVAARTVSDRTQPKSFFGIGRCSGSLRESCDSIKQHPDKPAIGAIFVIKARQPYNGPRLTDAATD